MSIVTNMSYCRYWVSITIHNVLKGHPFLIQVKLFETLRCCQDCLLMTRCWHSESVTSSRLTHVWITECMTGTGAAPPLSLALEIKWPDMSYLFSYNYRSSVHNNNFILLQIIPPPPANCLHLSPITCESGLIKISSETMTWRNKNIKTALYLTLNKWPDRLLWYEICVYPLTVFRFWLHKRCNS